MKRTLYSERLEIFEDLFLISVYILSMTALYTFARLVLLVLPLTTLRSPAHDIGKRVILEHPVVPSLR